MRTLSEAGVNAGVLMAPVVPGFTTQPAKLEATIKACADHGAAFVGANVLYLKGGTKDHFMGFLRQRFPADVTDTSAVSGPYAPPATVPLRGLSRCNGATASGRAMRRDADQCTTMTPKRRRRLRPGAERVASRPAKLRGRGELGDAGATIDFELCRPPRRR